MTYKKMWHIHTEVLTYIILALFWHIHTSKIERTELLFEIPGGFPPRSVYCKNSHQVAKGHHPNGGLPVGFGKRSHSDGWNDIPIFDRKYIFIQGPFSIAMAGISPLK